MNRHQIVHRTVYTYSGSFLLRSHELRLRPREGHNLRIESSRITIQPEASQRRHRDVEANCVAMARSTAPADRLLIESSLISSKPAKSPLIFWWRSFPFPIPSPMPLKTASFSSLTCLPGLALMPEHLHRGCQQSGTPARPSRATPCCSA